MKLSTCIQQYLLDCYTLTRSTKALYSSHLLRLVACTQDVDVKAITAPTLRSFMANLRKQDGNEYSPTYQDQVYRTLTTFFRWLVEEDILSTNPLIKVRRPRVPRRKSPRLPMSDIKRLISTIETMHNATRNKALIYLMLDSGLRKNEVLELGTSDLNLDAGSATVFDRKTKTEREVPLGNATMEVLVAHLAKSAISSKLFTTSSGTPLTQAGLQSLIYRLKKSASIPTLRCHLLRHTFANHYIAGGGGLRQLQAILGHTDIKTTASTYTSPELKDLQRQHAKVSPLAQIQNMNDSYDS